MTGSPRQLGPGQEPYILLYLSLQCDIYNPREFQSVIYKQRVHAQWEPTMLKRQQT